MVELKKGLLKDYMEFLSKAVSDEKERLYLNQIYYNRTEKRAVATDGRRLHIIDNMEDIFPGFAPEALEYALCYKKGMLYPAELEGQYPNYKRILDVIKVPAESKPGEALTVQFAGNKKHQGNDALQIAQVMKHTDMMVNYKFLLDSAPFTYTVYRDEDRKKLIMEAENATVIIASMQ